MLLNRMGLSMAAIVLILQGGATFAQINTGKPIRMVTSQPGGGTDLAARMIVQGLASTSGQLAIVDNRSGGMVPPVLVSQAPPDGNTLLIYTSTLWIAPLLEKTPYEVEKHFAAVTLVANSPNIIVVNPALAANSVKELIALAKAKPGALNYNSGGTGASSHLSVELFKSMAGIDMMRIPYKSLPPAITDLIGGRADVMFPAVLVGMPHVKSGRLRALAVTTLQPSALAPGLPTVAAAGLPGYESVAPTGLFAPGGTPQAVLNRLNQLFVTALNHADTKEKFFNTGSEVVANSAPQFQAFLREDITRMAKVIKDAGIKAD